MTRLQGPITSEVSPSASPFVRGWHPFLARGVLFFALLGTISGCAAQGPRARVRVKLPSTPPLFEGDKSLRADPRATSLESCPMRLAFQAIDISSDRGWERLSERVSPEAPPMISWMKYFFPNVTPYDQSEWVTPGDDTEVELEVPTGRSFRVMVQGIAAVRPKVGATISPYPLSLFQDVETGLFRTPRPAAITQEILTTDYDCVDEPAVSSDYFEDMLAPDPTTGLYTASNYARYVISAFGMSDEVPALSEGATTDLSVPISLSRAPLAAYSQSALTSSSQGNFSTLASFSPFLRVKLTQLAARIQTSTGSLHLYPFIKDLDSDHVYRGIGEAGLEVYSYVSYGDGNVYLYPLPGPGRYQIVLGLKCMGATACVLGSPAAFTVRAGQHLCLVSDLDLSTDLNGQFTEELAAPGFLQSSLMNAGWVLYSSEGIPSVASSILNPTKSCIQILEGN